MAIAKILTIPRSTVNTANSIYNHKRLLYEIDEMFFLKLSEATANKFADDPELTMRPNFLPNKAEILFSNSLPLE